MTVHSTPSPVPAGPGLPTRLAEWAAGRPWLALAAATIVLAMTVLGWAAGRGLVERWRHRQHAAGARLLTVVPPPQVDPAGAGMLWANLAGVLTPSWRRRLLHGPPQVVWQYRWAGRQLLISVWVPGTLPPGAVEAAVRAAWPGATVASGPAEPPVPAEAAATGGHLLPQAADWLPLRTEFDTDPLRALLAAGSGLRAGECACVQILARPANRRRAGRARRAAGRLRDGATGGPALDPGAPLRWLLDTLAPTPRRTTGRTAGTVARRDPTVERDVRAVLDKTTQPLWQTAVRYAVAADIGRPGAGKPARLRGLADTLASAFAVYAGRNRLAHRTRMRRPAAVLAGRRLGRGFLASTPELAALAGLPQDLAVPGLARARAKAVPAPVAVPTGGRGMKMLGTATAGGHPVALSAADARHHVHMVGATGSGKTTLLANLALDDILAGRGTVVIEPHGDLVTDILDRLPASAAGRVVLFDPDQPNPPALNPLDGDDPDLLVDNLVSIFSKIFAKAWGPRMDDVMRVSCLTLLRHPNVTLSHIPPLLNSAQFRAAMTVGLDDPDGLAGFWQWYDQMTPALRSQVIGPVLARLRAFLLREFVKRTLHHPRSTVDMGRILDGGVLLARLPKGVLGEDTSRLLGSLILAQVWQAATARARLPADRRRDCAVYIDEAQNYLTLAASLDSMLAEARKYRMSLVIAHQDLAQLPRELLAAASANARNKIYFACAPEDAHVLARHTLPELDEHDLTHLDAYTAAARLVADGQNTPAFTLTTCPPRPIHGHAAAIRAAAAATVPAQDTSAVDELVRNLSLTQRRNRHPTSIP